jgi:ATPase subunit of ABC transporter with duplicated ATPase domains
VVTRVLQLREGRLLDRPGSYSEFVAWRDELEKAEAAAPAKGGKGTPALAEGPEAVKPAVGAKPRSREERKAATEEKIRRGRVLRESAEQAGKLEEEISRREARIAELELSLAREDIWNHPDKMKQATTEYAKLKELVKGLYPKWEAALAEHERVQAELEAED